MAARENLICGLPAYGFIPTLHQKPHQENEVQARRHLICALPANPSNRVIQEADDGEGSDVEELTERQYRRAMGYLIRIEEDEEDIEPMFRRAIKKMQDYERNSAQNLRPKREHGESSRGSPSRVRRRSGVA